jgi:hypothetical protein
MRVIEGDFYQVELSEEFEVVCYWDGFGVGTDEDQQRLLSRIAGWLTPDGCALIDVCTPWYWTSVAGRGNDFEKVSRRYAFDANNCRMLDRWWPKDNEQAAVTQSLRCYSPADLRLLLKSTGLSLASFKPGGAVDYEAGRYLPEVALEKAMQYTAKLVKTL